MSGHRIPAAQEKKQKHPRAHFWTDDLRGHGKIKNGKYREKSMSQKFKLEQELQNLDLVAS
jgi:hypothetical protein